MQYNLCFDTNAIREAHGDFALAVFITGIHEFDQVLAKSGWKTSLTKTNDGFSIRFWLDQKTVNSISEIKFIKEFGGWKGRLAKILVFIVGRVAVKNWMLARLENIKTQDAEHRDAVVVDRINGLLQHVGVTAYRGGQRMSLKSDFSANEQGN